jgi:tRNA(Ile)-lysidine synthase
MMTIEAGLSWPRPSVRPPPYVPRASTTFAVESVHRAVGSLLNEGGPLVLAVSGGLDSSVLLDAVGRLAGGERRRTLVIATFDHGTGSHASAAVAHVQREADRWGIRCVAGAAAGALAGGAASEAAWREARWNFLRGVAAELSPEAAVATAHTRDDQVETIVMRIMRGAGARGLSALAAPSAVRRPLLALSRVQLACYADACRVAFVEDPTNADRRHFRNRVRHDLLPALVAVRPSLATELLELGERATALRRACREAVAPLVREARPGHVVVDVVPDASWDDDACALFQQTVAEFAGLALDWRGTERLSRFSVEGRAGTAIPLSGGYEAVNRGTSLELRRRRADAGPGMPLQRHADTTFGRWHFRAIPDASLTESDELDPWRAWLPADGSLEVRAWRAGDRMASSGSGPRRVKRFLSDRRVAAADREGWPVVVADGEIVWIPGVRRACAATARSGRPRVCVVCEHHHR